MATVDITWQNLTNATINGDGDLEKTTDTLAGAGCMDNASGTGDAGARSVETVTAPDWEFRFTLGPPSGSGRTFVGIESGSFSLDYTFWDYCFHVSTFNNTSGTPHPPDSVFWYQGSPPNLTYLDGVWNEGDLLRIVCVGSIVRAYINSLLFYTSSVAPSYPLHAVASLACLGGTVIDPQFITSPSSGGSACEPGPDTGEGCRGPWEIPMPAAFPPVTGGRLAYFNEIEEDWQTFGQSFPDGVSAHNTILATGIRQFEFEYVGLSEAQAIAVDAHWNETRGGLPFTVIHPHTGASITGVRYDGQLERDPHEKVNWQIRRGRLIKYTS